MKALYNLVTFLAAVVVLGWASWCTYTHWDLLVNKSVVVKPIPVCPCCKNCKCGKTDCKGACCDETKATCCDNKKCCGNCGCTDAGCCKK